MTETDIQWVDLGEAVRHDDRGLVFFPLQGLPAASPWPELAGSLHLISIEPGQLRGQHHHPGKTEWLYVFHGVGELFWRTGDGNLHSRPIRDNRTLVIIPPGVPHTLKNDGPGPLYLLAWRAALTPGNGEPDTVAAPLLARTEFEKRL